MTIPTHLSYAPDYNKYLWEKRDKAHIKLIEYNFLGMDDPHKFNYEKLRHLLANFHAAAEPCWRSNYAEHEKEMKLIKSILDEIDNNPDLEIGIAFQKVMKLIAPESPFKVKMQSCFNRVAFTGRVNLKRPLNRPTKKRPRAEGDTGDSDE